MASEQSLDQDRAGQRTIRLVRPSVVVLCGPAACGKSTFAERHFRSTQVISSDRARALVCDDERDQRFQAQAFAVLHFLIEQRLSINRLCVVDSTAVTSQARRDLLELARKHQVPCVVILFDVPLERCLERDQSRERSVGAAVIERQYQLFEQARAAIRQEGFDEIIELPDGVLDKVDIEIRFRPVPQPAAPSRRPELRGFPPRAAQAGQAAQGIRRDARPSPGERRPAPPTRTSRDARRPPAMPPATPAAQAAPAAAPSAVPDKPAVQPAPDTASPPAAPPAASPGGGQSEAGS
jgi:predicted kinase